MSIEPGQPAPDFTLPRDGGEMVSLSALRGQAVVLFFYPADSTSSCTTEAQDFTTLLPQFQAARAQVLGVSSGSVPAKEKFVQKAGLGVPLLADESGEVVRSYGVWQEKSMYGKTYMGIVRTTVLIDRDGFVSHIWSVSRVKGHAQQVLEAARHLQATA
ncbi:peroxiredoxin [Rubellimicrobium rubrum]|uniref:thioredoxin-dependent peroxiredoxin n=1 Tax=Rubellimicrobium rubrum TaxID=2585369 RepID=A0A5C4N0K5_9RHOB|nr:peroxiredoxin [Rubellimicrobium rubrum]TNC50786.1 peroxiredoxin [Rubellimicrobium rubrum]